ncbi:tRNA-intron endonuclease catalytic domain-like protein [Neoconidiobolus thromboides FSU 785]|nr:tRNA-intron endonuclease catalytic domain-like protein [Neoconidiobolus thromboides FSU 785]
MEGSANITITLVGNLDLQLLLWNLKDVELLRSRYRMVCNFIGCLPSNPLQNHDNSLPALLAFEQLLILLNLDNIPLKNEPPISIHLEQFSIKKGNDLSHLKEYEKLYNALPKAPPALLAPLNRISNSSKYLVYLYLYQAPQKFFITSGSKFGGDYLLYYDDPERCHSRHIVNTYEPNQLFTLNQLVSYGRLATGVNKTRVLATVKKEDEKAVNIRLSAHLFTLEWSGIV